MIERVLLDRTGKPLLSLYRVGQAEALATLEESLPDIMPGGQTQDIPGTGVRLYLGGDHLSAGNYSLTLGTYGRTHSDHFNIQRTVLEAAIKTRYVRRERLTLPIVNFAKVSRTFYGGAQLSGRVTLEFVPASPYWLARQRKVDLVQGGNVLHVTGQSRAALRLTVTAGGQPVTEPEIVSDAGRTRWLGTIPSNGTLVIDARPGLWEVSLNGDSAAALLLSGPQPYLDPGTRTLALTAPGAAAQAEWHEGEL